MEIDLDNKRKRQEEGNKNTFALNTGDRTKALPDSTANPPIIKPTVNQPTNITSSSDQHAV